MKHIRHWLMTATLLLCSIAVNAEAVQIDGVWYNLMPENKQAEVTRPTDGTQYTGDISIPSSVEYKDIKYTITSIGDLAFNYSPGLTSISIPIGVTEIGRRAFAYCSSLTSITIPVGVTEIGENVFYECGNLASVSLPEGLTSIGNEAFVSCSNLTSITLPNSLTNIGEAAFLWCDNLTSISLPQNVVEIGESAFCYCRKLTSINIPNGIKTIKDGTFYQCMELLSISLPESITSIGEQAFMDCHKLSSINIPESVVSIGRSAFEDCRNITSITIPERVEKIGIDVFTSCEGLESIVVVKGNTKYDSRNGCNAIIETSSNTLLVGCNSTIIPENISSIGEDAFCGCSNLTSIEIPNSVTEIGEHAFWGTPWLANQGNGVVYAGNVLYCYKGAMPENTSIIIREGTTSITPNAFLGATGLISISLPESITKIGHSAFQYCSGLTSIFIPQKVTEIGEDAFYDCTGLTSIMVEEGNTIYDSRNDCNAIIETNSNTLIKGCSTTIIPENVVAISSGAFMRCSNFTFTTFPESVTKIGEYAFSGTAWYNDQPDGVIYVGKVLYECKGEIPENTSIEVKEGTVSISPYAFTDCWEKLSSITFPESLSSIGYSAFQGCSNLSEIICNAATPPICENEAFEYVDKAIPIYVPKTSVSAYQAADGWNKFTNIQPILIKTEILDSQNSFVQTENEDFDVITYTRTLPNTTWNALYVPFEIPVSELVDNYDVAYINDIRSYDRDENGVIDDMTMEIIRINSGTLNANYPYIIRAKSEKAKNMELTLTDATLYKTEENAITCSSVFMDFKVTGTYTALSAEELEGMYAISTTGEWQQLNPGTTLKPFRLYMEMTARGGMPVKMESAVLSRIRICVQGEEDKATGMDFLGTPQNTYDDTLYDLNGRKVTVPVKGGIYIRNGKKVYVK